jgi:DsbC/DsbD-like thiol-disulfide interchange protein
MLRILTLALGLAAPLLPAPPARATTQDDVLQASVLTGWQTERGTRMVALRLDLAPGWKTYWRAPGEAGIPPEFDWSASRNLRSIRIHWPAPTVFETAGFTTIGYHDRLILPVEIEPVDPGRPVELSAVIDLGICSDICLPASLALTAVINPPGAPDAAISAALAARPKTGREAGLTSIACTVEPIADGLRLTAVLALPPQGGTETVAIESADRSVWVSEASASRDGGRLTAVTDLVPAAGTPFALDRSGLTVTVISARGAVEVHGCPAP